MASTCDKRAHKTKKAARRSARRERSLSGRELWVYHCDLCGHWHLTRRRADWKTIRMPKKTSAPNYGRGRRPAPGESLEQLAERMRNERG